MAYDARRSRPAGRLNFRTGDQVLNPEFLEQEAPFGVQRPRSVNIDTPSDARKRDNPVAAGPVAQLEYLDEAAVQIMEAVLIDGRGRAHSVVPAVGQRGASRREQLAPTLTAMDALNGVDAGFEAEVAEVVSASQAMKEVKREDGSAIDAFSLI